jgi:hypothetical protein
LELFPGLWGLLDSVFLGPIRPGPKNFWAKGGGSAMVGRKDCGGLVCLWGRERAFNLGGGYDL